MCDLHALINQNLVERYPLAEFQYPTKDNDFRRLLNWPRRLDGRGWPQQVALDNSSLHDVILLVRVDVVLVEDDNQLEPTALSVLLVYNALGEFRETARVLGVYDGDLEMISQLTSQLEVRVQAVGKVDNVRCRDLERPTFSVSNLPTDANCFQLTRVHGMVTMVRIRLWFRQSGNGQYCAFPSEWHGPTSFKWTSLLVMDMWGQSVVAVVYGSGECFFPNKPLAEWSIADEAMVAERDVELDHGNTCVFSPDGCLISIWQGGHDNNIRIIDCKDMCEHLFSCRLPKATIPVATGVNEIRLCFAGSVAFDPGSLCQNGRAGRIAYTSMLGDSQARAVTRFAANHSISVCDLCTGSLMWSHHHPLCLDDIAYSRYGDVLAATALTSLNAALDNWDVLLFCPMTGQVLSRLDAPHGMFQLYCSPLATCVLLFNFLHAAQTTDPRPAALAINGMFPSLRQLARLAIHQRVFSQADAGRLPLPPMLQQYVRCSLPLTVQ